MPTARTAGRILLGLLAAGALLFLGDRFYEGFYSRQPVDAFLNEQEGVASFRWVEEEGEARLVVRLQEDEALAEIYPRLEQGIARRMAHPPLLVVEDERTPVLVEALQRLRFDIEEAMATGQFGRLPEAGARVRGEAGLDRLDLAIDEHHLYVTMEAGGKRLHAVFDRTLSPEGGRDPA